MFTTSLVAEAYPGKKWRLERALVYVRHTDQVPVWLVDLAEREDWVTILRGTFGQPMGYRITIPAGFVTDLASIPRLLRAVIDVNGAHREEATLHDFLYSKAPLLPRLFCDQEFNHAMAEDESISTLQRVTMYRGVRLGGWVAFNKHKKRNLGLALPA